MDTQHGHTAKQKQFLQWYEGEKARGLIDIKFYPGDVSKATLDEFIDASLAIDHEVKNRRHSPLPDSI